MHTGGGPTGTARPVRLDLRRAGSLLLVYTILLLMLLLLLILLLVVLTLLMSSWPGVLADEGSNAVKCQNKVKIILYPFILKT